MKNLLSQRPWFSLGLAVCALLILAFSGLQIYRHSPRYGLPYRDSFAKGEAAEWKAYGGTWELVNGMMRNDSDERGAKLITGSPHWHNYSIEADVYLLGISGDAGLIIRSSNEQEGVNAYSGYYAGVRTIDNSLVLGRAEHGWMEVTKQVPASDGIRPFHWYHLKLLAFDCQIFAAVTSGPQSEKTMIGISDPNCVSSGRVGLRSYSSGGVWRNIVVRPATQADVAQMRVSTGDRVTAVPQSSLSRDTAIAGLRHLFEQEQARVHSSASTQSIASLRLMSFAKPAVATVRGVVILTAPQLFVQDSTGGVYVPHPKAPLLKVGDEVEVTGDVLPGSFSSTMEHATVRMLWARTPMPPVSITASQASTGKYDATFIEVRGRLADKKHGPGNTVLLDLDEGPQSFRAVLNPGRSDYLYSRLEPGSVLRLRGVCVVDSTFTHDLTPFVLLLRSNEDLDVIAGPPWWSTGHVIAIVVVALLLALVIVHLYHRVQNWRLRTILEERGRLAHEMHDTLAQSFAGIGFQLQAIRNELPGEMSTAHQQLELASNLVRHSHEEARRSIATLRSEDLESDDLLSALELCAKRMVDGGSVRVTTVRQGDPRSIPLRIADTLYRIGQEAVANAVRHAQPTHLTIRLIYSHDTVCLQVEDNGSGFTQSGVTWGFGIRGMRRRVQGISGAFHLHSQPGEGTQVTVEAPLPPRVTLISWPKLVWKFVMEHGINARPTQRTNSHSYRG
jgi:signal transduction histidine kinase